MGFFDSALSIATGGISDIVSGDAPFSSLGGDVAKWVAPFVNPGAVSAYGVKQSIHNKDYGQALNYMVDPITEPGIDTIARGSGPVIGKISPELRKNAATIGATIGTIAAYGAPWGTLAGYEIGNKIAGGSGTQGVIGGAAIGATAGLLNGVNNYISNLNAFGEGLAGASGAETTGYLARQAALNAAAAPAANSMMTVSNADIAKSLLSSAKDAAPSVLKLAAKIALQQQAAGALNNALPSYTYNTPQPSWSLGGLLNLTKAPSYTSDTTSLNTPSFTATELPKLSDYDESKEKKIAEALTDEYKNYKLNDYMLYKQDPDKLQELILRYT